MIKPCLHSKLQMIMDVILTTTCVYFKKNSNIKLLMSSDYFPLCSEWDLLLCSWRL